tara:strand:+ start:8119 stop:9174 length:1056 start_codon:yes stop_codon:yes gene_type:complete
MDEIVDRRKITEFKNITFSKYKKSDAKKELLNSLIAGNLEVASYWSAEFIAAGQFLYLWEIFILVISKNIHVGNPKLPIYLDMRITVFKEILNTGYSDNILKMRNNDKIRKLFAEICCVICYSNKKNTYDVPKIQESDFDFFYLTNKLSAKNKKFGRQSFKNEDPSEIFIAINELSWNISIKIKKTHKAIYWVEWLLEYHKICKKKKIKKICARRQYPVEGKFQKEMIWIIWDVILVESKKRGQGILKINTALLNIFCLKYQESVKFKRKLLIYYALSILTENYDFTLPVLKNTSIAEKIKSKINFIYKEIRKSEERPATDYLFNNIGNNNLEKTINKIEKLNNLAFIPRV